MEVANFGAAIDTLIDQDVDLQDGRLFGGVRRTHVFEKEIR